MRSYYQIWERRRSENWTNEKTVSAAYDLEEARSLMAFLVTDHMINNPEYQFAIERETNPEVDPDWASAIEISYTRYGTREIYRVWAVEIGEG